MEFKKDSWSVGKIEEIDATDSIGKIFKLSDVKYINNPNEETIHYPGKTFMGTATLYIWHYLYETIAQFEYLKTYFVLIINALYISPFFIFFLGLCVLTDINIVSPI